MKLHRAKYKDGKKNIYLRGWLWWYCNYGSIMPSLHNYTKLFSFCLICHLNCVLNKFWCISGYLFIFSIVNLKIFWVCACSQNQQLTKIILWTFPHNWFQPDEMIVFRNYQNIAILHRRFILKILLYILLIVRRSTMLFKMLSTILQWEYA